MTSSAMPSSRKPADGADDLGMGADVDAARRLVEDQEARIGRQPAGEDHLLLVAAGQQLDRHVERGGADVERLDELAGDLDLLVAVERAEPAAACPAARG